jgi:hypothetical protein
MSKKITLQTWAGQRYETVPHRNTLQRWARDGWIFPLPEKHGREYVVEPHARFVGPNPDPNVIASAYRESSAA